MTLTRGFVQNGAVTPLDARFMDQARLTRNADGTVRTGLLFSVNPAVIFAQSNMTVQLADQATLVVSRASTDGAAILLNNGAAYWTLATAPTSNSRIDVLWVKMDDSTQGDADSLPTMGVTTGTAAASPTKPATPAGVLELGQITVPAGGTATNGTGFALSQTVKPTAVQGAALKYVNVSSMQADSTNIGAGTIAAVVADSTAQWNGRYQWSAGVSGSSEASAGWYPKNPLLKRYLSSAWNVSTSTASGQLLASFVLPSLPYAYRAIVRAGSQMGNGGSANNSRIGITAPGATITGVTDSGITSTTGQYGQFYTEKIVDVPAFTAVTVSFTYLSTGNSVVIIGTGSAQIYVAGEY